MRALKHPTQPSPLSILDVTTQAREGIETALQPFVSAFRAVTTQAREGIETCAAMKRIALLKSNNSSP